MSKFLDDAKIIKKSQTQATNIELVANEPTEEIIEEPKPRKRQPKQKKQELTNIKPTTVPTPKNRTQIIIELIDRFNAQSITKEVELKLCQEMYRVADSNEERKRYETMMKNMAKDIKELKQKIDILNRMEKNNG